MIWSTTAGEAGDTFVVLIHGALDRSAGLLKLSRRLDEWAHVARYDRRGYGRSTPHEGPFGIPAQVDDLVEVIGRHRSDDTSRTIAIGHSYGGNVALATAQRHPGLLDAVVTYESPLSWLEWWGGSAGSDAVAWRHDPQEAAERFMRRLIGDERWERLPEATRTARRAEGPAMVGELAELRERPAWSGESIDVPVLALYGEHGKPHHQRGAETIAAMIPGALVERIDGAAHFGPNTHPDLVAERVRAFVDRVPVSGRSGTSRS
jgi:pimeloyl-ACP methyl ester carboxylesterase